MKAVSLFSGCGGMDWGLARAGIETVLQAEIDPVCREVLSRHWPNTRRVNDVRDVGEATPAGQGVSRSESTDRHGDLGERYASGPLAGEGIDLVYGGFPCQPFSVAGKREGDRDERNLWPEFRRVVRELRPSWVLAENVPGILSFDDGRFFGSILDDLGELGFEGVAYAVLDSQHFGVPQRRRRVFIVGGPTRRSAEQVLSLCESCGGNPSPGRAAGEGLAYSLTASVRGTGDGHGNAWNSNYVTGGVGIAENQRGELRIMDVSPALSGGGGKPGSGYSAVMAVRTTANTGANGHGVSDLAHTLDGANGQAVLATAVSASAGHCGDGSDNLVLANPLTSHHRRDDLDNDTYIPAIVGTLASQDYGGGAGQEAETQTLVTAYGVRRLTPLECERLQGWPDDWTKYGDGGRVIPDSARYRMIGNGVVAPVAEWIGRRIVALQ